MMNQTHTAMRRFLLLLSFLLIGIVQTFAHDFEVDGIYYNILSGTTNVEVTRNDNHDNSYSGSVTIPSSVSYGGTTYTVTSIGDNAFAYCSDLTSIALPSSVTSIGKRAIVVCPSLASIVVNSNNPIYDSRNGCNGIIEKSSNKLVVGCKNTVIPSSVTEIGEEAFWVCTGLTNITIPSSVTRIDGHAFYYCKGLTNLSLPSSITSIGENAFASCTNLASINLPSSLTTIGEEAFYECKSLTNITLPASLVDFGEGAFADCSGLTDITIPLTVTSISEWAFCGCTGLTSITIHPALTTIGNAAFADCPNITNIVVESGNTVYDSRNNCNAIIETSSNKLIAGCKNTVIPTSVTSIGSYAFHWCTGLTSISIPSSVTSIGDIAFHGCEGLTDISIPSSVTDIGNSAFSYCTSLPDIVIPSSVTSLGERVFSYCSSLKNITIRSSIADLGPNAFLWCSNLENITLPSSMNSIGKSAFSACRSLTYAKLPSNIKSIEEFTFSGCTNLVSVAIPSTVTSIGKGAFASCNALTDITIPSSVGTIDTNAFSNCSSLTSITMLCLPTPDISNAKIPSTATIYVTRANYDAYTALGLSNRIEVFDDNILYLDNQELQAGTDATLSLKLKNNVDITSLQFDLVLPEGITIPNGSNGKPYIEVSPSRTTTSKHKVNSNLQEDGSLRVVCTSFNNDTFSANDGEVLKIHVNVAADATVGLHDIRLKNMELGEPNNTPHDVAEVMYPIIVSPASYTITATSANTTMGTVSGGGTYTHGATVTLTATPADGYEFVQWSDGTTANPYTFTATANKSVTAQFQQVAPAYLRGDANNDGRVNVQDYVGVAKYILQGAFNGFVLEAADINDDHAINVRDYLGIAQIILYGGAQRISPLTQDAEAPADMDFDALSAELDADGQIAINLNNAAGYAMCQFDVTLPTGMTLAAVTATDRMTPNHTVDFAYQGNNTWRVLIGTLSIAPFKGHEGSLLRLQTEGCGVGMMTIDDALFVTPDDAARNMDAVWLSLNAPTSISSTLDNCEPRDLYNLQGVRVQREANRQQGVYIMNGKKTVVK